MWMNLNQYLIKKGTTEYRYFSEIEEEIREKMYKIVFNNRDYVDYEIDKNDYKKLSYNLGEFNVNVDSDDEDEYGRVMKSYNQDANFDVSLDVYYNVPNPSGLIDVGNGYFISQFSYAIGLIEKTWSVQPRYSSYDDWKLGNDSDYYDQSDSNMYLKIDNNDLQILPAVNESKKITTKKIYEVKKQDKKYLLVEAIDGFYKTTDLKNINKYKKVNEQKVKKFIGDPSNAWKGIQVTDLYISPMVIEEFENPDEKLQQAIDEFKRKTGIKLEKVYTSNDKLYLHGENKNYSVEIQFTHKNGKYELKERATEVIDKQDIPKSSKMMINKIMSIIFKTFAPLGR